MIFEGEYINGKRWKGKGKEYHYGFLGNLEIKFEGEYKNREKAGIGKEFNNKFIKGEWHKKGKEYDKIGNLIFEGNLKMEKDRMEKEKNMNMEN